MANKKNTITNREALEMALECVKANGGTAELISKLEHMAEVAKKPTSKTETAEQREMRERFMPQTLKVLQAAGKPVDWKHIAERVNGAGTAQKVAAIMKKLIAEGSAKRIYDGRATMYAVA